MADLVHEGDGVGHGQADRAGGQRVHLEGERDRRGGFGGGEPARKQGATVQLLAFLLYRPLRKP